MNDYIVELLAGELRRRAPHVVPNPEDSFVYGLAEELAAEGHETTRTVPTAELDARIRSNTLKAAEDSPEDFDDGYDDHDLWDDQQDREDVVAGDILMTVTGLQIATPTGRWSLTEEQGLQLISRLSLALHAHLTTPWAADDSSTILSRGRAALTERN